MCLCSQVPVVPPPPDNNGYFTAFFRVKESILFFFLNLNAFVSGSVSLNCVGHTSFHYHRVNGGGYELGKFGVELGDKEQNAVGENSLNNYPLKKFHLGFIGRQKLIGVGHDLLTKKRSYWFEIRWGFLFEYLCISWRGWREKRTGKTVMMKSSTTPQGQRGEEMIPLSNKHLKVGSWDMTNLE